MPTKPSDPLIPSWSQDQLDSSSPPEPEAAYFDPALQAWVLSKYQDVMTAFRASGLAPCGPHQRKMVDLSHDGGRARIREETIEALSPVRLREWRERISQEADRLADGLSCEELVDLMGDYARPLCLSLAAMATGISREDGASLHEQGRRVSASAAEPYAPVLRADARTAKEELGKYFHFGPESLRSSGFVALSQTLPCLLGNAWFSLVRNPAQWTVLHQQPALTERAIEELLRYAGLTRTIMRIATIDIDLNGCFIREGERIILRIIAANHDDDRFSHPHQVDINRNDREHFTLGAGPHSCVAAGLIRMAAVAISRPLLQRFGPPALAKPVEWQGGSGFRFASALWVHLPRNV